MDKWTQPLEPYSAVNVGDTELNEELLNNEYYMNELIREFKNTITAQLLDAVNPQLLNPAGQPVTNYIQKNTSSKTDKSSVNIDKALGTISLGLDAGISAYFNLKVYFDMAITTLNINETINLYLNDGIKNYLLHQFIYSHANQTNATMSCDLNLNLPGNAVLSLLLSSSDPVCQVAHNYNQFSLNYLGQVNTG